MSYLNATCPRCHRPYLRPSFRDPGCPSCPPAKVPVTRGQLSLLPHDGRTRAVHTSEEHDVYAGRANAKTFGSQGVQLRVAIGQPGWLGNPWPVREFPDALERFERYFRERVENEPVFRAAVLALKGKRLGCPGCPTGSPCHARIIAEWVETNACP